MWIPFHNECKNGHLDLEKNIDFNVVDKIGWTVRHYMLTVSAPTYLPVLTLVKSLQTKVPFNFLEKNNIIQKIFRSLGFF